MANPFITTGKINPEYFCDRVTETERIIKTIDNGNNLLIISPRRMGKTGLIQFCYDKKEIKKNHYTFFVDILHTTSLKEFTYILGKELFKTLIPESTKMISLFVRTLKSLSGKFGFDPNTNLPTFNIELGDIDNAEFTLDEIFRYINEADKRCIIAIDEFQQIAKYPENNIEALLRTHIQKSSNCNFIFAGSERHMLQEMFNSSSRPFYNSTDVMELNEIPKDKYIPFVEKHFVKNGKKIGKDTVEKVYDLFEGHTYYMQKTFNEAFAYTDIKEECTLDDIRKHIRNIIDSYDTIFREVLSNIPEKQKLLLYAIAHEGKAEKITSADFIKRHSLISASSVQSASKILLDKDIITETSGSYSLTNRFFAMWIERMYGNGFSL